MRYRMLKDGETIRVGDECLPRNGRWTPAKQPGRMMGFNGLKYRRKVAATRKNITTLDFLLAIGEVQHEGAYLFQRDWIQWEESVVAADLLDRIFKPGSGWPQKIIDRKLLKDAEFLKETKVALADLIALGMRMKHTSWLTKQVVVNAQELLDKTKGITP